MKKLLICAAMVALPAGALAQSRQCQAVTYCDEKLVCQPTTAVLDIAISPDGSVTLMWDGKFPFSGRLQQAERPTVVIESEAGSTASLLTIGTKGTGLFTTVTDFGDYMLGGVYSLTCAPPTQ